MAKGSRYGRFIAKERGAFIMEGGNRGVLPQAAPRGTLEGRRDRSPAVNSAVPQEERSVAFQEVNNRLDQMLGGK